MIPSAILQIWAIGLISLGVLAGAGYALHRWQELSWKWDPLLQSSVFAPDFSTKEGLALFVGAGTLLALAFSGRLILAWLFALQKRWDPRPVNDPFREPMPHALDFLKRPDGSLIHVRSYGRMDGMPVILSHGWGFHSGEWNYLVKDLSDRFRVVTWDEPGLGQSSCPINRDFSLASMAAHLSAILETTDGRPAILVGHSIGGMIVLNYCQLHPESLGSKVAGVVLAHTTPTNPVRTTSGATFYTAIEKPILMPLLKATILLSPLVRLMNWLSYSNGTLHVSSLQTGFGGRPTWQQVEFAARLQAKASPAVLARGMLGMMRYDASSVLPRIEAPALIIAGDKDPVTEPHSSEWMYKEIPNARIFKLSRAKHLGPIEHHQEFGRLVRDFAMSLEKPVHA